MKEQCVRMFCLLAQDSSEGGGLCFSRCRYNNLFRLLHHIQEHQYLDVLFVILVELDE